MPNKQVDLVRDCKRREEGSILTVINRFRPLIRKYKKKLGDEDAEQDLIEYLIIS